MSEQLTKLLKAGYLVMLSDNVLGTFTASCRKRGEKGVFGTFDVERDEHGEPVGIVRTSEGKPNQHATADTPECALNLLLGQMNVK